MTVNNFIEKINSGVQLEPHHIMNTSYSEAVHKSYGRQFGEQQSYEPTLRVSSLGKPVVMQAMTLAGYTEPRATSFKGQHIFHTGDILEELVLTLAKALGHEVKLEQAEVNYCGVLGHIDAVIDNELVELKTMSQNYFNKFVRTINDDRGYITQLAIYQHCLGLPASWLCLNKGTHELVQIVPDPFKMETALARASRIIPHLRKIRNFKQVCDNVMLPPPTMDSRSKLMVLPESIKWWAMAEVFYELESVWVGKTEKRVVVGFNDYITGLRKLEKLIQNGQVNYNPL